METLTSVTKKVQKTNHLFKFKSPLIHNAKVFAAPQTHSIRDTVETKKKVQA
jgi:hypothetical protein